MEINLLDLSYISDHYVTKISLWLVNIYTSLTEQLTAMEKLVSESATRDRLAIAVFSGLIAPISAAVGTTAYDIQTSLRRLVSV
jgi:hypothetical protein